MLYIMLPESLLPKSNAQVVSKYDLIINVTDDDGSTAYQEVRHIKMGSSEGWKLRTRLEQVSLNLDWGKYIITTSISSSGYGKKIEKKFDLEIPGNGKSEFNNMIVAQDDLGEFVPQGPEILTTDLKACYLIAPMSPSYDSMGVAVLYKGNAKDVVYTLKDNFKHDLMPFIQQGEISELYLLYYKGNLLQKRSGLFHDLMPDSEPEFSNEDQIQLIRLVANQNEWKSVRKLAKQDPEKAISLFWENHASTPGDGKNEFRELLYSRVTKANEMFTIHKKMPGWKSDRGKVFIKKGEPDDITQELFPNGTYPHIIWRYFKDNSAYYFVDKTGYGNFKLVDTTDED